MKRSSLVAAAYTVDWLSGDPEWLPHPVRMMGWMIRRGEQVLRHLASGRCHEFAAGRMLAFVVPVASALATRAMIQTAHTRGRAVGVAIEVSLGATCLASRNLLQEARKVLDALETGDLPLTRRRLARIVGRDTEFLDEYEICRALIETVAESLSDGIVAPMLYLALGGVPLAMAYKAVNTLDSMIGHRDEQYLYFGRFAARVDDAANWIPARLSAFLICVTAGLLPGSSGHRAAHIWLRDGSHHASPNAGQSESAMSGALAVRLGGVNHYAGERIPSPHLGGEFGRPDRSAACRACRLVGAASLLACVVALFVSRRLSA
jgi:adenosylcobinamide-phosphate synthase